jgi:hypothetical protein
MRGAAADHRVRAGATPARVVPPQRRGLVQQLQHATERLDRRRRARVEPGYEVLHARLAEPRDLLRLARVVALDRIRPPPEVALHRDVAAGGAHQRLRVPSRVAAGRVDLVHQRPHGLGIIVPDRVPRVGVLGDESQHTIAGRPDQDRRAGRARTARPVDGILRRVELALPGRLALPQQRVDDANRILEARDAVVEWQTELVELRLVPSRAEPEDEASPADVVDRLGHLRDHAGVAEAGAGDERADGDVRHARGDARHHRERLPHPALSLFRGAEGEVVGEPESVEADLAGDLGHFGDVGEMRGAAEGRALGDRHHQPDSHRADVGDPVVGRHQVSVGSHCCSSLPQSGRRSTAPAGAGGTFARCRPRRKRCAMRLRRSRRPAQVVATRMALRSRRERSCHLSHYSMLIRLRRSAASSSETTTTTAIVIHAVDSRDTPVSVMSGSSTIRTKIDCM